MVLVIGKPIMHILTLTFRLLRYNTENINCNLKRHCFMQNITHRHQHSQINPKVTALRSKLVYCDYLDSSRRKGFKKLKVEQVRDAKNQSELRYNELAYEPAISVILDKYKPTEQGDTLLENKDENYAEHEKPVHMPYSRIDSYESVNTVPDDIQENDSQTLNPEYKDLYEKYIEAKLAARKTGEQVNFNNYMETKALPKGELWKVPHDWMCDIEQYDDTLLDYNNCFGTPDPSSKVSSIPCGGCGALLHCKDTELPGYLPSELFSYKDKDDLSAMICQRCHFLKYYNAALEVKVSIEDYPKLLRVIKEKRGAIILLVDLTDFPCSIWPDLKTIMNPFTPIFIVGNKVDLLPRDCPQFFDNVKRQLVDTVLQVTGIEEKNIAHVALASAKTGYGIEELINKLQHIWGDKKSDVYLVGCTNVGKSSMFNILLNSDYCKVQAVNLVPHATISAWPGTTLNLLKFPILNPFPDKKYFRVQRLKEERDLKTMMTMERTEKFRSTGRIKYATLKAPVGRTFTYVQNDGSGTSDSFTSLSHETMPKKLTFDDSDPKYKFSRWCYDTPGTIQQDQILDLLTTDELLLTLPDGIISPRTFVLQRNQSVFVAGLGRLDYVEGDYYIRCTLFASLKLPITICCTDDADDVYNELLETEAFVVPTNNLDRLKLWPKLESKDVKVVGVHINQSAADIVLSSTGWVAITPLENENVTIRAWTPQARGIHLRTPALLSKSVALRGFKIQGTPMYFLGRQVYIQ